VKQRNWESAEWQRRHAAEVGGRLPSKAQLSGLVFSRWRLAVLSVARL